MESAQDKLTINWSCQLPPAQVKTWHRWPTKSLSYDPLEETLAWPQGTIRILEEAFSLNLSRFCGWDLSSVTEPDAYEFAARLYKRGVPTSLSSAKQVSGSYPVIIEPVLTLEQSMTFPGRRVLIDATVASLWNIQEDERTSIFDFDEVTKNLETVAKIVQTIRNDDPGETYILVGGGVFCDTAAFAVGLLQRKFELVPTTLLAMVDACVGGKTGVNFPPFGKNQLGLFLFPERVTVWTGWLRTLDEREVRAGLAECYKHALLSGDETLLAAFHDQAVSRIEDYLPALIRIKADVVSQDPGENGLRATLNLGHTFAHSVEALSHKRGKKIILHGEAVALGLAFQAVLSQQLGHLEADKAKQIFHALQQNRCLMSRQDLGLCLGTTDLRDEHVVDALVSGIQHDKKNDHQAFSQWILLKDFGETLRSKDGGYTVSVDRQAIEDGYLRFLEVLE
ncbi:MAG: 3-dehydroquinate synthase [Oligoflexus sp.]